jgi:hypothetical protein
VTYCLTCWQPWATAIVRGFQQVEERTWTTSYRGRLYVHAGLSLDEDAPAELIARCRPLVLGAIVGEVTLVDVRRGGPTGWEWLLADPVPWEVPISCRGWPGLWPWSPE